VAVGPIAVLDGGMAEARAYCLDAVRSGRGARVATANLDFVARARRDAVLRDDLAQSSIVVADGAPVAWLARLAGGRQVERVTGVDLVHALCEAAPVAGGLRVAFYGSTPEVAASAAGEFERRYPGVEVILRISPPFRPATETELYADRQRLRDAAPDLVLVALGCPKQERFIAEFAGALPGAVWIGVGGTLDFYAGIRRRAPRVAQRAGLEWLVRLVQEPGRLWRRYIVDDLPALVRFAPGCLMARLRRPAPSTEPGELVTRMAVEHAEFLDASPSPALPHPVRESEHSASAAR
jgi:N-acetylglucosaminyldiphosphoundecaprenol N-acetyl-beta-D-mannosaminyltransferase